MSLLDKVSKALGFSSEEEEKEIEQQEKEELQAPNFEPKETEYISNNVVAFPEVNGGTVTKTKITTIKPKDFQDAQTVANCLREKVPVIVNFEDTEIGEAKRIIDFISGTTYAINGAIRKVSQEVFICAPDNVTVACSEDDKRPIGKLMD